MDTIRTDTWIISLPSDWIEKEAEGGAIYFESTDGEKAIHIATWNLGEGSHQAPGEVAESFRATDMKSLNQMAGYSWQTIDEELLQHETSTISVVDSLAQEQSYRIVGKILCRPPVVVRASFHDYACSDYATSKAYLAPIIRSLCFNAAPLGGSAELQSTSPFGCYQVFVDPWEARGSLWVYSPLIIDVGTQELILKLADLNWSMDCAVWESDTTVRLGLRRFPGDRAPFGISVQIDCASRFGVIGDSRFPLVEIDLALERALGP